MVCRGGDRKPVLNFLRLISTDGWVRIIMPAKRAWAVVNTFCIIGEGRNSANMVYEKHLQEADNKNY